MHSFAFGFQEGALFNGRLPEVDVGYRLNSFIGVIWFRVKIP